MSEDITAHVQRILGELARHEPPRRVRVAVGPGLARRADPRMVEVALRNPISNAWKYPSKCPDPAIRVEGSAGTGA
jgi:hypothetical protein